MPLTIKVASGIIDFLRIRRIRNQCRFYMTRDQHRISLVKQIFFFLKYHYIDFMRVMFIGRDENGKAIAYGCINYDSDLQPWITGGIKSGYRGRGYGTSLFKFLSDNWSAPVQLEVLADNERALKLYNTLGFSEIGREQRMVGPSRSLKRVRTIIIMKKLPK